MEQQPEKFLTIDEAAKVVGVGRDRARELAIKHRIARRWGGSDAHPWLRVRASELQKAIESERYVPLGSTKTHPLVKC